MNRQFNNQNTFKNYQVSFSESILFFLIIIIVSQVISAILYFPTFIFPELSSIFLPLSFLFGFGSAFITLLKIKGLKISEINNFLQTKVAINHILIAIIFYIVSLPTAEYLSSIIPTEGYPLLEKLYEIFLQNMNIIFDHKISAFLMACILAPLLEELIFRGFILRGMLQKGINPWVAIVWSSILFGIAHMNPWQFMGAGFLGIIFGFVYWRTKSLWITIFLHFINNAIAFYVTIQNNSLEASVFEPNYNILLASIIFIIILGIYLFKKTQSTSIAPYKPNSEIEYL